MGGSRLYILPLLLAASLLAGCLESIEKDTSELVASMNNLDKNTANIASTLEKLQTTADQAFDSFDSRVASFEKNFELGVEKIQEMATSLEKLDRIFEMAEYVKQMTDHVKKMGNDFESLNGTLKKFDILADEALKIMEGMSLTTEPTDAESDINSFISPEEQAEIDALMEDAS